MFELCSAGYVLEPDLKSDVASLRKKRLRVKNLIFGWRLIHNNLPCRMEFVNHGVIVGMHNRIYLLCFVGEEDLDHFFMSYVDNTLYWNPFSNRHGVELDMETALVLLCFRELKRKLKLKLIGLLLTFIGCLTYIWK